MEVDVQPTNQRLKRVLSRMDKIRLKQKELAELKTLVKNHLEKSVSKSVVKCYLPLSLRGVLTVCLGVIIVIVGIVIQFQLHRVHGFSTLWFWWENIDIDVEECTIESPPFLMDIFRPAVDCSMCNDIKQIERVKGITQEIFEKRYAYTGRPVVIEDGQRNWSASEVFSFSFFQNLYGNESRSIKHEGDDCLFFPYQTEFKSLAEALNMSEERSKLKEGEKPWYIGWSNCDASASVLLRRHYNRPYFLPSYSESTHADWIFMGANGYGAKMHVDHVFNPSWQAQITGRKKWFLKPPPECYFQCQQIEVTVEPGEIIVLDTNRWYHATLIVSSNISITIGSEYD